MRKGKGHRGRPHHRETSDVFIGKFEYDRAEEKRKLQEEIEDLLEEREESRTSSRQ